MTENQPTGTQKKILVPPTSEIFKNESQNIRKVTVGEIDPKVPFSHGKVLMLLGATGAGKSTLINGLVNYIRGVAYKDDYRYKLVGDEGDQSQAHSQTKWITAYTFQKNERLSYTFTIIDTPGYGDTDGIERDRQLTRQIKEFFSIKGEQSIDHIDGIGFVVQASQARLTHTQRYIFDSILSIFGNDISKNVFMMITFADAKKPPVLASIKQSGFKYEKFFKFNNSALFPDDDNNDDDDDDDDDEEDDDSDDDAGFTMKSFWKMGEKSFKNFFKLFCITKSVSLQLTKEVLEEREKLECLVQSLQRDVQVSLSKVDQLRQEKSVLFLHEKDMVTNKDFTYEIEETRQNKVDLKTGEYVTNCLVCNCTCHYPCYIPNDGDKYQCAAMANQNSPDTDCGNCPGKCYWSKHVNNPYRFDLYIEKVTKTSQELKKRYEAAKGKKSQAEKVMDGLSNDLMINYKRVLTSTQQTKECIDRLGEIALRPCPLTNVEYIDLLIDSQRMEAKPGWHRRIQSFQEVRKQAELLSRIKNGGADILCSDIDQWIQTEQIEKKKGWFGRVKVYTQYRYEAKQCSEISNSEDRMKTLKDVVVLCWAKVKEIYYD